jgi:hypothetical protein
VAKQSSAEKAEFWKLAIAEQGESGLSIKAFCRQQSLSEPSFHAWKRKFKEQRQSTQSIPLTPVRIVSGHDQPGASQRRNADVQIRLPSGIVVELFSGEDA